ncbi:MAG TPA: hypothetical protein VF717_09460 [Pyrinomonadaceae bacterium]|jgi:hypothetical protein
MARPPITRLSVEFKIGDSVIYRDFTFRAWLPALESLENYRECFLRAYEDWKEVVIKEIADSIKGRGDRSVEYDPATPGAYLLKLHQTEGENGR